MPFFENEKINIYYEIAGEGPPLLLVNGLAGDARQWQPLVEKLKKSFKIISYDMRCVGRSDKPDASFSIEDLADEAHALISHLGHHKVCALGFSMGGMVVMNLALKHPKVVSKMFLVATTPSLKRPHPPLEETLNVLRRTDVSPELLTQVFECIFGSKYRKKVSATDFIDFRMHDENPQPAFAYLRQLDALESCDLCQEVGKISAPAIMIVGDEDKVIPSENSKWLNAHIKNSKLFTFEGIGHMVPVEEYNKLADVIVSNK